MDRASAAKQAMQYALSDLKAAGLVEIAFQLERLIGKVDRELEHREAVREHPRLF